MSKIRARYLWETHASRFATKWEDLPHHDQVSIGRLVEAQLEVDLSGVPSGSVVKDRHDDIGIVQGTSIHYPETATMSTDRASKKYGPFMVLHWGDGK